MNSFTLPAFAKINLLLRIISKREDGFHDLFTVFQTVSLHDDLTFSESDELELTCDDHSIPTDSRNLIIKAAQVLREKYSISKGAKIHLEKRIPFPGGLGGGSSDCATALLGLSRLWEIETNRDELIMIGSELGSDVPFFFYGGTAIGTGRGTEIIPVADVRNESIVLVTPNEHVSTKEAFQRLNVSRLTKSAAKRILKLCRDEAKELCERQFGLYNDFEKSIFESHPEIQRAKELLLENGASDAVMSGSGATVFGIFSNEQSKKNAIEAFARFDSCRVFDSSTVSSGEYLKHFADCKVLFPH